MLRDRALKKRPCGIPQKKKRGGASVRLHAINMCPSLRLPRRERNFVTEIFRLGLCDSIYEVLVSREHLANIPHRLPRILPYVGILADRLDSECVRDIERAVKMVFLRHDDDFFGRKNLPQ